MSELLEIKNLCIGFPHKSGEFTAVRDVSLTIRKNETVAVVGESGSGKSLTSLSVLGLLPENSAVKSGSVLYNGRDVLSFSKKDWQQYRGREVSMIFQDAMALLNPGMKVGRQIAEGLHYHKLMDRSEQRVAVLELLRLVGFADPEHAYHQYPHQLSGGMKQRVMIALAVSCKPKLIIADEPTTALDVTVQKQVLDLLSSYKEETGTSVLLITHDLGVVAEYADRVNVMYRGQIVESSDVYTLFDSPLHPYTKALMASIPAIGSTPERLKSIHDYMVESGGHNGMQFAPATYGASPADEPPSRLVEVEPGHFVRFFREGAVV
ncbi:ABC transporter ATP-binding protein [Fictibacillus iocasae]|uniref:ABC transporter ATP-binding protein n=1 Tax=Fictibacillus iocasae TaxID=2715437 RepID=A0ABW2NTR8_9BACL